MINPVSTIVLQVQYILTYNMNYVTILNINLLSFAFTIRKKTQMQKCKDE